MSTLSQHSRAVIGTLVHAPRFGELEIVTRGALVYDGNGIITRVLKDTEVLDGDLRAALALDPLLDEVVDYGTKLVLPGLVDAHCHAPQYVFTGTGMDLPLLEWLNKYTFPCESRFKDLEFARLAYTKAVSRHLSFGTTFCSYFGTIHGAAADLLVDIAEDLGQRAFVGKVSMDRNSPDFYIEDTSRGVQDACDFAVRTLRRYPAGARLVEAADADPTSIFRPERSLLNSPHEVPLVLPCVTPRFVPTCTAEMLTKLGVLSAKYGLPMQSHLSESTGEIAWVRELHPECSSYAQVYHQFGLLHTGAFMAHCIHSDDEERRLLLSTGCGVVHCPSSNFNLMSGVMDCRRFLAEGVKVGLGTDVAGGHSPSMLDAIRQAIVASTVTALRHKEGGSGEAGPAPLSYKEALYLATMGSAQVLNMDKVVGSLEVGKKLDVLVVDVDSPGSAIDCFGREDVEERVQKWLFLGDDRNLHAIYVDGRQVKAPRPSECRSDVTGR